MQPGGMTRVYEGMRYDTGKAQLVASDCFWDGHNFERHGRNQFLYTTPRGGWFLVTRTQWQGERDSLEPVSEEEARELYEGPLCEHEVPYETAFPDVELVDA